MPQPAACFPSLEPGKRVGRGLGGAGLQIELGEENCNYEDKTSIVGRKL